MFHHRGLCVSSIHPQIAWKNSKLRWNEQHYIVQVLMSPKRGMARFMCPKQFYCSNQPIGGWSERIRLVRIFSAPPIQFLAPFLKWRQIAWFGHTNFFSMGDNSKILFPSMGFSYPSNSKKNNFCHLVGSQWAPGGLLAHFWTKMPILGQTCKK